MSAAGSASQGLKRKNFNVSEREEVVRYLLADSEDGVRQHGSYHRAAEKYGCHWETIKRIWQKHEKREESGDPSLYIGNDRKGHSGCKGIDIENLRARLLEIPLNERTTQRRLAAALGIPKSTLHNNLKALGLRAHSPVSDEAWLKGTAALAALEGQGGAAGGRGGAAGGRGGAAGGRGGAARGRGAAARGQGGAAAAGQGGGAAGGPGAA
ncbi:unnamed protein product [Ectocarpus sp. CCAP 1310/34]|nr:unnamed protein product [Ectocarpus sp. CCAP 1310/34]